MAATGFKQKCPSCDHPVAIKDDSLVGRKIDCPKCKYRFVVEGPGDEEKPKKKAGANGKGPTNGKAKTNAQARTNGQAKKPVRRPARDDDEEDEEEGEGSSKKLLIGLGILGVGVVL